MYQNDPNTLMCHSTFNSRKEAEEVLKILEQDYPFYNWKIEVDHVLKHYLDAPFAPKLSPFYKIWGTVEKDRVDIMYEEFLRIYERNDYVEMVKFLDKLSNDRAKDLLNKIMRDLYARK